MNMDKEALLKTHFQSRGKQYWDKFTAKSKTRVNGLWQTLFGKKSRVDLLSLLAFCVNLDPARSSYGSGDATAPTESPLLTPLAPSGVEQRAEVVEPQRPLAKPAAPPVAASLKGRGTVHRTAPTKAQALTLRRFGVDALTRARCQRRLGVCTLTRRGTDSATLARCQRRLRVCTLPRRGAYSAILERCATTTR